MARTKKKKLGKESAYLFFLLTPLAIYMVHIFLVFLLDTYMGDGMMLHQFVDESRRQLVLQMFSDGLQALPLFYAAGVLLWLEVFLFSRFLNLRVAVPSLAGALTGLVVAVFLVGNSAGAAIPFVLSGLLMGCILDWIARHAGLFKGR
jgi:presenilin-like A22 family membrane protease